MIGKHASGGSRVFPIVGVVGALLVVATVVIVARSEPDRATTADRATTPAVASQSIVESTPASPGTSTEPSPQPKKERLVIHAAGDTNLDPNYVDTFRSEGYGYAWTGLDGLFQNDDLTIVNLECAVSNKGSAVPKEFNFRGDPAALPAMRKAGVEIASLANNHSYDFGPQALVDTVKNIRKAGITPIGAGSDDEEAEAPAYLDIKGWKIAVVPWDFVVDPYPTAVAAPGHPGTAFGHDFNGVLKTVKAASRNADLVIVQTHWGVELETRPNLAQVPLGHRLIDAGADIIFGGHSHRIQPLEIYKGKPIFWSLGNFVWPLFSIEGAQSGVAEVTVEPDGTIKARLLPATITAPGHPELR